MLGLLEYGMYSRRSTSVRILLGALSLLLRIPDILGRPYSYALWVLRTGCTDHTARVH